MRSSSLSQSDTNARQNIDSPTSDLQAQCSDAVGEVTVTASQVQNPIAAMAKGFLLGIQLNPVKEGYHHQEHAPGWCIAPPVIPLYVVHTRDRSSRRSPRVYTPLQCTVNSKLWNVFQFNAKLSHLTTYLPARSARSYSPIGAQVLVSIEGDILDTWPSIASLL